MTHGTLLAHTAGFKCEWRWTGLDVNLKGENTIACDNLGLPGPIEEEV